MKPSSNPLELLAPALSLQQEHEAATTAEERKARGQVFTPPEVCRFMAGLFSPFPKTVRLLDPGAGVGSLTAAVCERLARLKSARDLEIHVYETDPQLLPALHQTMQRCRRSLKAAGHAVSIQVHAEDFILSNATLDPALPLFGESKQTPLFDSVIMNPPYFKISANSAHARLLRRIVHGQPNIYALFMAVTAELLRPGGELVAITPRSFCNGLYFRGFRRWFFERMALHHAHLFESRKAAFKEAGILQESLITRTVRAQQGPAEITVSSSHGREELPHPSALMVSAATILDDSCGDMVVRLPTSDADVQIMQIVESWPRRFLDHGLQVSTGPVVSFRATQFLARGDNGANTVPLIHVGNVRVFDTVWPLYNNGKPDRFLDCDDSQALLLPTKNYVLLRRFSAKEERRRLTASCFLRSQYQKPRIALENHLNYVYHTSRELTEDETFGLAALFNSCFLDRYFRTLSGNTQVNATELRTIPLPELNTLARLGLEVRRLRDRTVPATEAAVLGALSINGPLRREILGAAR